MLTVSSLRKYLEGKETYLLVFQYLLWFTFSTLLNSSFLNFLSVRFCKPNSHLIQWRDLWWFSSTPRGYSTICIFFMTSEDCRISFLFTSISCYCACISPFSRLFLSLPSYPFFYFLYFPLLHCNCCGLKTCEILVVVLLMLHQVVA